MDGALSSYKKSALLIFDIGKMLDNRQVSFHAFFYMGAQVGERELEIAVFETEKYIIMEGKGFTQVVELLLHNIGTVHLHDAAAQVIGDLPDVDIHLKIRLHDNRAVKISVKLGEDALIIEFKLDAGLVENGLHLAYPFPVIIVGRL